MAAQRKPNSAAASPLAPTLHAASVAETLRLAQPPAEKESGDEKMSVFWRVFGGTILSILVTILITAYQSIAGTMSDLRASQNRLVETQADLARKDDVASKTTQLWAAQKQIGADMPVVQTRTQQLETQLRALEQDRKECQQQVQKLTERVILLEARATARPAASAPPTTPPPAMGPIND